ncbi:MAG: hypothetical protein KJO82_09580 [Gammaproteobacteria bacterium]|nr:hypothetical protein [Gammaproteobacteria bacterium]
MSNKYTENDSPVATLKNESSRQRWEMFHRAIAHAKESNDAALTDADVHSDESVGAPPLLSIVR